MKPNIHRLQIPLAGNPLKELNSYLITGKRNLLIDTGFRTHECRQAITGQLEALGVNFDKTDIFLTHLHSDHTGLAVDLHREGCQVFVSASDHERMCGYASKGSWSRSDDFYLANGFPQNLLEELKTKNPARANAPQNFSGYTPIDEGRIFQYGGYDIRSVATPGHTPGHMCLYIESEKLLFLGDHILFDITPNITSWSGFPNSLGHYLKSLDKIKTLDVAEALPGHRESGNMYQRADALKAHHRSRLAETLGILRAAPGSAAYDIAAHMTWRIKAKSWEDFPVAQKWFAVGEAIAHLDYLQADGHAAKESKNGLDLWYPV